MFIMLMFMCCCTQGEKVVMFPSDFSALVQELFHNKVNGDRAADIDAEKRALKVSRPGPSSVSVVICIHSTADVAPLCPPHAHVHSLEARVITKLT